MSDHPKAPQTETGGSGRASYWNENLKRLGLLLSIWFLGSFGVSILFVDELDQFQFFGFRLGFWFAQQGSIYIFLALILVYVRMMNRLDATYADAESAYAKVQSNDAAKSAALSPIKSPTTSPADNSEESP